MIANLPPQKVWQKFAKLFEVALCTWEFVEYILSGKSLAKICQTFCCGKYLPVICQSPFFV
jgi:hypothetical protein